LGSSEATGSGDRPIEGTPDNDRPFQNSSRTWSSLAARFDSQENRQRLKPRNTLHSTHAHGQLQRAFFAEYVRAYLQDGNDKEVGDAYAIFEGETLQDLQRILGEEALQTQVVFTDNLSNRNIAIHLTLNEEISLIAVNARFKFDPEILAHALVEEFAHAQQVHDKIDFASQRRQYAYADRPYEIEAKQIATDVLGYEADYYESYLMREEPESDLYDRLPNRDDADERLNNME
jgi:hypothetical protein